MDAFKPTQGEKLWLKSGQPNTIYREYTPCRELQPYVACYWVNIAYGHKHKPLISRVIPDGCMDIVFDMSISSNKCALVVGLMTTPDIKTIEGISDFTGVRFKPGGLIPFIRSNAADFTDQLIPLYDVIGYEAVEIGERIYFSGNLQDRVAAMEKALLRLLHKTGDIEPFMAYALGLIYQQKGTILVNDLAARLNIGQRQLSRKFNDWIGINPKAFSKIIRFQNIISELNGASGTRLLDLGLRYGYYDQAHFIKEFKTFYGMTPGYFY